MDYEALRKRLRDQLLQKKDAQMNPKTTKDDPDANILDPHKFLKNSGATYLTNPDPRNPIYGKIVGEQMAEENFEKAENEKNKQISDNLDELHPNIFQYDSNNPGHYTNLVEKAEEQALIKYIQENPNRLQPKSHGKEDLSPRGEYESYIKTIPLGNDMYKNVEILPEQNQLMPDIDINKGPNKSDLMKLLRRGRGK